MTALLTGTMTFAILHTMAWLWRLLRTRDKWVQHKHAPAEKLYEELLIGENAVGTEHPRIMCASEDYLSSDDLAPFLDDLALANRRMDRSMMRDVLVRVVKEYEPKNDIDDLVWEESEQPDVADESKVVSLNPESTTRPKAG